MMDAGSLDRIAVLPGDCLDTIVAMTQASTISLGRGLVYSRIQGNDSNNNSSSNSNSSSSSNSNSGSGGGGGADDMSSSVHITANCAGTLRFRRPGDFWVDNVSSKFYVPEEGDQVVALVDDKGGDFYRVAIRAGAPAVLNRLGFDGASKRSKPEYKRGDVIFCRVLAARPDADVEVTCLSNSGTKKEWSSGETVFGGLQEGCLVYVPLSYTKYLLRPECVLLESIAKHFAYEVSIGANGVVWLKAEKAVEQVVIRNCILSCQDFDDKEIPGVVDMIVRKALQSSK